MKIVTEKAYIGWYAYDDETYDGSGPVGHGATETEAINDLRDKLEEDEQRQREFKHEIESRRREDLREARAHGLLGRQR